MRRMRRSAPVDFSVAEDALIVRPDAEVEVRIVPPGGALFVAALAAGETLVSAAETAQAADGRFDLAGNIAGLFAAGALCRVHRGRGEMAFGGATPRAMAAGTSFMIFLQALASLALRFALALPFWKSGLTRWEGFLKLRPATTYFYEDLYKPTLFGKTYASPIPRSPRASASMAEIVLPAALVIGFATRLSALGLLVMTGVIYLTYQSLGVSPDQWQTETLPWGAMALALIAYGPGLLSFDRLIWTSFRRG